MDSSQCPARRYVIRNGKVNDSLTRTSMPSRPLRSIVLAVVVLLCPVLASAQDTSSSRPQPVVTPQFDFSGIIFGSYGLRTDSAARATLGGASPNQFTIDRAYLNFRMPAGDNAQVRITPDIFQNLNATTGAYYQGWVLRLKYGYLQYSGLKNKLGSGSGVTGRVGILQTAVIDYIESFWPRYLGQVAIERYGYFSSADAGVSGLVMLGHRWGEVYATVTNGPGYQSFDRDRFKDVGLRASITPLANVAKMGPILRTFAITPWGYKGWIGSTFAAGGPGQNGPGVNGAITSGLPRDRWGIFTGVKERRLVAGAEYSQRMDESDTGGNTALDPRIVNDSTGRVVSGFIIGRPVEWFHSKPQSPVSFVARYDRYTPNVDPTSVNYAGTTPKYSYWLLGISYDATQRVTFTLDWQVQTPHDFPPPVGTNVIPVPRQSTLFAHWVASF
jgi:hypothetical protein